METSFRFHSHEQKYQNACGTGSRKMVTFRMCLMKQLLLKLVGTWHIMLRVVVRTLHLPLTLQFLPSKPFFCVMYITCIQCKECLVLCLLMWRSGIQMIGTRNQKNRGKLIHKQRDGGCCSLLLKIWKHPSAVKICLLDF